MPCGDAHCCVGRVPIRTGQRPQARFPSAGPCRGGPHKNAAVERHMSPNSACDCRAPPDPPTDQGLTYLAREIHR
jgi:hypothetical protein